MQMFADESDICLSAPYHFLNEQIDVGLIIHE